MHLNPEHFRIAGKQPNDPAQNFYVYRSNLEEMLDKGLIEVAMRNGNWWRIRRNGRTQTWKRDPNRIRIPFKMGLYGHGAITEADFVS